MTKRELLTALMAKAEELDERRLVALLALLETVTTASDEGDPNVFQADVFEEDYERFKKAWERLATL